MTASPSDAQVPIVPDLQPPAKARPGLPPGAVRKLEGFPEVRHALLEAVGAAKQRLWLTTEFLTDGEFVTSLYLAQYRKLDVKVLLGRARAGNVMSRLNYLKAQKVPVFLKPDAFKPPQPTALLADDTLLLLDSDLDSRGRVKSQTLSVGTLEQAKAYAQQFADAAKLEVPAISQPVPMVGRANTGGKVYGQAGETPYNTISNDGAYRYERRQHPRPAGVPDKLPRTTKSHEQRRQQEAGPNLPPEAAVEPDE